MILGPNSAPDDFPLHPRRVDLLVLCLAIISGATACRSDQWVKSGSSGSFEVGKLPPSWVRDDRISPSELGFRDSAGDTIIAGQSCPGSIDPQAFASESLDVVDRGAHTDFKKHSALNETSREVVTVDRWSALRTHQTGGLAERRVEAEFVTVKTVHCFYSLRLMSTPTSFERDESDFRRLVDGFHEIRAINSSQDDRWLPRWFTHGMFGE